MSVMPNGQPRAASQLRVVAHYRHVHLDLDVLCTRLYYFIPVESKSPRTNRSDRPGLHPKTTYGKVLWDVVLLKVIYIWPGVRPKTTYEKVLWIL